MLPQRTGGMLPTRRGLQSHMRLNEVVIEAIVLWKVPQHKAEGWHMLPHRRSKWQVAPDACTCGLTSDVCRHRSLVSSPQASTEDYMHTDVPQKPQLNTPGEGRHRPPREPALPPLLFHSSLPEHRGPRAEVPPDFAHSRSVASGPLVFPFCMSSDPTLHDTFTHEVPLVGIRDCSF